MRYPTIDEVANADRTQLARWTRFLKSPGSSAIDEGDGEKFRAAMKTESVVLNFLLRRFHDMGGMTPEISKEIGWDE